MEARPRLFVREATGLLKELSSRDALMLNVANMGVGYAFLYLLYGPALFPGVNMLAATLIALPLSLLVAGVYFLLSSAIPRTGGDYVFVSRILHPALGFMNTFWYIVILVTFVGIGAVWVPQLGLSPLFWQLGTATGNSGLTSLGQSIGAANNSAIIATIIVIVYILVLMLGVRRSTKVAWFFFGLMFLGFIVFLATMLAGGNGTFIQRFSQISGTTPEKVISAAQSAGYPADFTWGGTLLGIVYSVLNYAGFVQSVYFAGEIKGQAQKSQLYSIFGALISFAIILSIFYGVVYAVTGTQFWNALAYTFVSGNSAYTLPIAPTGQSILVFATDNPILISLGSLTFVFALLSGFVAYIFLSSRIIFAWSFDRLAPTQFASLDKRFNSPYLIILLIGIIGIISVYLDLYTSAFTYLVYSITGYTIIYAVAGLTAIVFPYIRKDIFENAPSVVKRKIGGVPLIVLLGVATLISNVLVGYATLTPAFTGGPINPIYAAVVLLISVLAIVLFYISYAYNKSKGVNLSLIYREIPPE